MPSPEGPDAQATSITISVDENESRKIPAWVEDPQEAEKIWSAYNSYLRGSKPHQIATDLKTSPRTVYRWIEQARAELPYQILNQASEMIDMRMQWIQMSWDVAEKIQKSGLGIAKKAEQISKLMNATGAWFTAVEELSGARRGTGSRMTLNAGEGHAAIVFDMDVYMKAQSAEAEKIRSERGPLSDTAIESGFAE